MNIPFNKNNFATVTHFISLDSIENITQQQVGNTRKWKIVFFTLVTFISILNGQSTPFYIIYFFWFNEFIHLVVDKLLYKLNPKAFITNELNDNGFGSFVMMGIYWVFIVLVFGFIANFANDQIFTVNLEVLVFQNWFFNINLIGVAAGRIFLHLAKKRVEVNLGTFSPNMLVLHLSIIVGCVLLFFIVRKYPTLFTPDNFWGSVLIVSPFLLLKMFIPNLSFAKKTNSENEE